MYSCIRWLIHFQMKTQEKEHFNLNPDSNSLYLYSGVIDSKDNEKGQIVCFSHISTIHTGDLYSQLIASEHRTQWIKRPCETNTRLYKRQMGWLWTFLQCKEKFTITISVQNKVFVWSHPRLNNRKDFSNETVYFCNGWLQFAVSQKCNPQVITENKHKWPNDLCE